MLVNFWLHISRDEQLRRFEVRERTGFKRFKIMPEDWCNRDKWGEYESAACDMIDRTGTEMDPWTLVEANQVLCPHQGFEDSLQRYRKGSQNIKRFQSCRP